MDPGRWWSAHSEGSSGRDTEVEQGRAGTIAAQMEAEDAPGEKERRNLYEKEKATGACVGPAEMEVFPKEQGQVTGELRVGVTWSKVCFKEGYSGCHSTSCLSWLLQHTPHLKTSVPSICLRFLVCIHIRLIFFSDPVFCIFGQEICSQ